MKKLILSSLSLAWLVTPIFASVVYRINGGTPQPLVDFNGTSTINVGNIGSSMVTVHIYDPATLGANGVPVESIGRLIINGTAAPEGRLNVLIADGDSGMPLLADDARLLPVGLVNFGGDAVQTSNDSAYTSKVHDFDSYPYPVDGINRLGFNDVTSIYDTDLSEPGYQIDPDLRGLIIPNPNLRRATVLAMSVSGDVCPEVALAKDQQLWIDEGAGHTGRIEVGQVLVIRAPGRLVNGAFEGGTTQPIDLPLITV